jgi:hypothetical protein
MQRRGSPDRGYTPLHQCKVFLVTFLSAEPLRHGLGKPRFFYGFGEIIGGLPQRLERLEAIAHFLRRAASSATWRARIN